MKLTLVILLAISCFVLTTVASPVQIVEAPKDISVVGVGRQAPAAPASSSDDDDDDDDDDDIEDALDDDDDDDDDDEDDEPTGQSAAAPAAAASSDDEDDDDDDDYLERFFDDILGDDDDDDDDDASPSTGIQQAPVAAAPAAAPVQPAPVAAVEEAGLSADYTGDSDATVIYDDEPISETDDGVQSLENAATNDVAKDPTDQLAAATTGVAQNVNTDNTASLAAAATDDDDEDEDDEEDIEDALDDDEEDDEEEDDDDDDDDEDLIGDDVIEARRARALSVEQQQKQKLKQQQQQKQTAQPQPNVPEAIIQKYDRFVDNIFGRINKILKKSYDPVNVRLQSVNQNQNQIKTKKLNKKKGNGVTALNKKNKQKSRRHQQQQQEQQPKENTENTPIVDTEVKELPVEQQQPIAQQISGRRFKRNTEVIKMETDDKAIALEPTLSIDNLDKGKEEAVANDLYPVIPVGIPDKFITSSTVTTINNGEENTEGADIQEKRANKNKIKNNKIRQNNQNNQNNKNKVKNQVVPAVATGTTAGTTNALKQQQQQQQQLQQQQQQLRGTLYGLSTIKRSGNVRVNAMSEYTTVKSNFILGPLIFKVEKLFGRGAKRELRTATATTTEMLGRITLRVVNGAATLHSIKVQQPKQVQIKSSSGHDSTRKYLWKRSAHIALVASQKLTTAARSMLQVPPTSN